MVNLGRKLAGGCTLQIVAGGGLCAAGIVAGLARDTPARGRALTFFEGRVYVGRIAGVVQGSVRSVLSLSC